MFQALDVICAPMSGTVAHLTGLPRTLGALCGGMLVLETTNTRIKSGYFLPPPGWQTLHFLSKKKSEYREVRLPCLTDSEKVVPIRSEQGKNLMCAEQKREDVSSMKWNRITVKCSPA